MLPPKRPRASRTPTMRLEDVKLKYLMNFVLAHDVIDAALSDMLRERGVDEGEFCRSTYMSEADLRELHQAGTCRCGAQP